MLFLALQSIVDGLVVGRMINAEALAAVNLAMPLYTMVTSIALIVWVGTQALMSIYLGGEKYVKSKSAMLSGTIGLAAIIVPATILVNCFADYILKFLGADENLMPLSKSYVHGFVPWLAGIGAFLFCDYQLKALGRPRLAMKVMLGTIALNAALCAFLIKTGMGIFGAGFAIGISFTLGAFVSFCFIWKEARGIKKFWRAKWKFSPQMFWHIFYNGSSEGLAEIAIGISMFLFNRTLMAYVGVDGVAAFTIVNYIIFVGINVMFGVANGMIPIISYNYGSRRIERIAGISRIALGANFAVGLVMILLLCLFSKPIISLFISESEIHVLELAVRGAHIVSLAFLFNGANLFASSFFTAVDRAGLSLLVAALRGLILIAIGIFTLPHLFGVNGIWLTIPIAEIITMCASYIYMRKWFSSRRTIP